MALMLWRITATCTCNCPMCLSKEPVSDSVEFIVLAEHEIQARQIADGELLNQGFSNLFPHVDRDWETLDNYMYKLL